MPWEGEGLATVTLPEVISVFSNFDFLDSDIVLFCYK